MSIFKKVIAGVCCLCTAFSVCACGEINNFQEESVDTENDYYAGSLNIRVWDAGFGVRWLDKVIAAFNDKYPDVEVDVSESVEKMQVFGDITGKGNKYDIIISESILTDWAEECLEPIDDVYSYMNSGESVSVGDKIMPIYKKYLNNKGHYYQVPAYVGTYGIVYNSDFIYDEEVPVTTEELKALCTSLKKDSLTPFIFSGEAGTNYWDYIYATWFAQYEVREAYTAAQSGQIIDANGELKYDPSAAYLTGGLKAMQVCEDLLWYENGNIKSDSTGLQFIIAQREFLEGKAAMMYNGSWLFNEMQLMFPNGTESDFKMMKIPVISAITEKCTTIENDAELAALVRAIDAGETDLSGEGYDVNAADFAKVSEARNFFYAGSEGATAVVPINARNKQIAKRFLTFMYSETGIKELASAKAGNILPVNNLNMKVPTDNTFIETSYSILLNNEVFYNNPVIAIDYLCTATTAGGIEKQFGSQNSKDRTRASVSFEAKKNLWTANDNEKFWNALISAGYIKERP